MSIVELELYLSLSSKTAEQAIFFFISFLGGGNTTPVPPWGSDLGKSGWRCLSLNRERENLGSSEGNRAMINPLDILERIFCVSLLLPLGSLTWGRMEQKEGTGFRGLIVWRKKLPRRQFSALQLNFIPEWAEIHRMGTAARTTSNLHLAAWSYHTVVSTKPNYHMDNKGRASAGICVQGHAWDRPGIQAQGHLVEVRPLSLEALSRSGGCPAEKGVLQFVPSTGSYPNMVNSNL